MTVLLIIAAAAGAVGYASLQAMKPVTTPPNYEKYAGKPINLTMHRAAVDISGRPQITNSTTESTQPEQLAPGADPSKILDNLTRKMSIQEDQWQQSNRLANLNVGDNVVLLKGGDYTPMLTHPDVMDGQAYLLRTSSYNASASAAIGNGGGTRTGGYHAQGWVSDGLRN